MAAGAVLAVACNKDFCRSEGPEEAPGTEICFKVGEMDVDVQTRLSAVTASSLETLNVMATTATGGAETLSWTTTATLIENSGGRYQTGKYWPYTNPNYHFYLSNQTILFESGAPKMNVDGTEDVVCGKILSPQFQAQYVGASVSHIYSWIKDITLTSTHGYEISDVSITLPDVKRGGKYNLYSGSWESYVTEEAHALSVGTNDVLVVPGTTSISVDYTLTKGDFTQSFTSTRTVTLEAGKQYDLNCNIIIDPAVAVVIQVTVASWRDEAITLGLTES